MDLEGGVNLKEYFALAVNRFKFMRSTFRRQSSVTNLPPIDSTISVETA